MLDTRRLIIWSVVGSGISSIAVQLLTIREFLTQFHGNEVTISLVLFSWLLLTGLGSLLARGWKRSSPAFYSFLCLFVAVWPLLQIVAIRRFREIVFVHGTSPGFYPIFFYITLTIMPYCLLAGFLLPHALRVLENIRRPITSGRLYLTDTMGDILGGALFSFVLVYLVKPFMAVAVTSTVLILISMLVLISLRQRMLFVISLAMVSCFFFFCVNPPFERSTLSGQYGEILSYAESPYGRIVVTKEGPQHTFWESGIPLYSDSNIANSEEKIHYPLSQLDRVENVLLISGGLGETLQEVLKHRPAQIDYLELDPQLTDAAQELGFLRRRSGLSIINTDGRRYVKTTDRVYDAIIVDLPEPDTFQLNRFYTAEFFALVRKALTKDGIFSFSLAYSPNYLSQATREKLSTIHETALLHFPNVIVLPGEEAYFLCRDGTLDEDIPRRLKAKAVQTAYVEGFYHGNVTPQRIRELKTKIDAHGPVNRDFEPRIMSIVFNEWFMKHGTSPKVFLIALLAFTIVFVMFLKKEEYVLFTTGFSAMGVEMLVVFAFQVIYGYVYLKVGAIVTCFLLGLLPGAALGNLHRLKGVKNLAISELILLLLLLVFHGWIRFAHGELHEFYFLAYCLVFSFFCGYQFPAITALIGEERSPAASCLAADLTGAALGTIVTGTLLIPLWGAEIAILFLVLVKISSNVLVLFTRPGGRAG